ncbi:ATP-binding protein [Chryseotalea sanaruensis]|uniref:ATP-binding protein n=1 Tax=Chryseotalea sanaruensis TaxID=2482724 RepID=A0A401UAL4_9BACT|nr:ATP-binding protein [Chryseotalea sanaruensis]GCC51921.1 ATP-binding protein [Chryseotalea sanaruensis]
MDLVEYFAAIDENEINRLVKDKQEENIHIEFKTVVHPTIPKEDKEADKRNYSKCLSGFANSSGGLVIWGIHAEKDSDKIDCAKKTSPIRELSLFLNKLNTLEGQATTPKIKGVKHKKIDIGNDTGFVVTFIPESETGPHMANFADKYYYKRNGDSFFRAEHYDIVDMFSRKSKPKLDLKIGKIDSHTWSGDKLLRYEILFSIINNGNGIAKHPYVALKLSKGYTQSTFGVNGNGQTGLKRISNNQSFDINYSGGQDIVIFPNSSIDVDKISGIFQDQKGPTDLIVDYIIYAEGMETKKGRKKISREKLMNS